MKEKMISEVKQARHRALMDHAPEPVCIFDTQTDRFIDFNEKARQLFKLSQEKMQLHGPLDLSAKATLSQDILSGFQRFISEALDGSNPIFEWTFLDSDGQEIPCQVRLVRSPPYDKELLRVSITDLSEQKKAEQQLEANYERYRSAIKASLDGFYLLESVRSDTGEIVDFKILEANENAALQMSIPREKLIGLLICDAFPINRTKGYFQQYKEVVDTGNPLLQDYCVSDESNTSGWYQQQVVKVGDGVAISNRDISERKRTEATIRMSEARYRAIAANFPNGLIALFDHDLRYSIASGKGLAKIGLTRADFEGKRLRDIFPPEIYERDEPYLKAALKGETISQVVPMGEYYFNVITLPVKDDQGEIISGMVMSQDVTALKKAELNLEKALKQLQLAIDTAKLGIWRLDAERTILEWNDQLLTMYGISREQFEEDRAAWRSQVHPEDREHTERQIDKILAGEMVFDIAFRLIWPDGEVRHMNASGSPVYDEQGKLVEFVGINIDITHIKRKEEALRERESFLQAIFDNSPNAIMVADDAGNYRSVNQAAANLFGYSIADLLKMNVADLNTTNVIPARQQYQKFVEKGQEVGEFAFIRPDEVAKVAQYHAVRARDNFNLSILDDITEKKEAEEALRKSEELFHTVFNQQFQFMVILSAAGHVLDINGLPLEIIGVEREDFIGKLYWESPAWLNLPSWQDTIRQQVTQAASMKTPLLTEDVFQTQSGDLHYAITAYSAIRNEKGQLRFILVQATDITDRKLAEDQLRATQSELSEITNRFKISTQAAQVGIWDWDIKTGTLLWDDTMMALYGMGKRDFSDSVEAWRNRIHPDDMDYVTQALTQALKGKKEYDTAFRVVWKDQSIHHIRALGTVQRDETGRAVRMIGTNWDITKEKEAEQQKIRARQLEIKNKDLEQFAYVASHDLQEPLRTVTGFAKLLERNYAKELDKNANEYLQFISEAALRMSELIKGLLAYSRIGINRELAWVEGKTLLQQALRDLQAQIEKSGAIIKVGKLPQLKGYPLELRVLFQNLISNAIKFRRKDVVPKIKIAAKEEKNAWVFSVKDNGIGIEAEHQEKIFAIFQRLHGRREYEGTGIGLAHCQKIVDLHGGKIWLESEFNKGSCFYFTIPK